MRTLYWDCELTPLTTHTWSLWPTAISIGQIVKTQEVMCYGARWAGEKKVHFKSTFHHGKQEMLDGIHALLDEADAVVSWNGKSFDSKHLRREFITADMLPPSPYKEIDLMLTVKSQFKFASNKLDHFSQQMGIGKKLPHEGFQLWLDCMAGDEKAWAKMKKYQIQDVNLLIDAHQKLLPWIKDHPNVALHNGGSGCPNCGGTDLQRRGYSYTGVGKYARFQCTGCGKWSKGSQNLAVTEFRHAT